MQLYLSNSIATLIPTLSSPLNNHHPKPKTSHALPQTLHLPTSIPVAPTTISTSVVIGHCQIPPHLTLTTNPSPTNYQLPPSPQPYRPYPPSIFPPPPHSTSYCLPSTLSQPSITTFHSPPHPGHLTFILPHHVPFPPSTPQKRRSSPAPTIASTC